MGADGGRIRCVGVNGRRMEVIGSEEKKSVVKVWNSKDIEGKGKGKGEEIEVEERCRVCDWMQ